MKAGATIDVNDDHTTAEGEKLPADVLALQITRKILVPVKVAGEGGDAKKLQDAIDSMTGA